MVRVAVLLGSARPQANTAKAMSLMIESLEGCGDVSVRVVDPRLMELPVPGPVAHAAAVEAVSHALQTELRATDGVIMITPEYDGTISAVMKLLLEYLGYPSALAGKPVLIVGVAGGRIGASRAVEHLRSIATHIGCYVLPGSVSVGSANRQGIVRGSRIFGFMVA
jgi:chromate reductase, NAD(P)H dehydrogenase (quinone)